MNDETRQPPPAVLRHQPRIQPEAPASQRPSMMEELARLIEHPPRVPKIGADASTAMRRCFETVAADIERLAAEHVARATQLQQEALSFSAIIREAGEKLCAKIEQEAVRGYQISRIMTSARELLDRAAPESGG